MSTDLANRSTVRQLVATYAKTEATIMATFASLVAAEAEVNAAFSLGGNLPIRIDASHSGYQDDYSRPEICLARMRRSAWSTIADRLELRRVMSIGAYEKLQKHLSDGDLPEITEETVHAFVSRFANNIEAMFEAAVVEVFDWLRPRQNGAGSQLKTNGKIVVGPKVIVPRMVSAKWGNDSGYRIDYDRTQHLVALENVFTALDGMGMTCKGSQSAVQTAIEADGNREGMGETPYFEVKAYANRNLHIRFKRLDLLAKFNAMAGGKNLRPGEPSAA